MKLWHKRMWSASLAAVILAVGVPVGPVSAAGATSIDVVRSAGVADGVFADGWKWTFHFTVPATETQLKIQFGDFTSGGNSIAVANNVRVYSPQSASNGDESSALTVTAANTYTSTMTLTVDADAGTDGRQISVVVEMKIPAGSSGGSYAGSYLVDTEVPPDTTPPTISLVGDATMALTVGGTFTDPGATATDNVDGDITSRIVVGGLPVDTSVLGPHSVTYNVSDAMGNPAAEVTRTVMVMPAFFEM